MKLKKVLFQIFIIFSLFGCSIGKQISEGHTHNLSSTWNTDDLYHWKVCDDCFEIVGKAEHQFDNGTVKSNPTDEKPGEKVYKCMICGKEKVEEIPILQHEHTYASQWSQDEISHWHQATCSHSDLFTDKGIHTFGEGVVMTEPTSESTGIKAYTCTTCGYIKTEIIPISHVHVYDQKVVGNQYLVSEASCTTKAKYYYSCSCGEAGPGTFEDGEPLGHKFSNYVSNNDATCGHDGTKTRTCSVCQEKETITDEGTKLEHTYSPSWSSDETSHWHQATCEHSGLYTDYAPHTWNEGVEIVPATETQEGLLRYTCTVCNQVKEYSIPKLTYYTVSFLGLNDIVLKTEKVQAGYMATSPTNYEVDGYKFIGWDKEFDYINSNLEIKALYEELYCVTFYDYDESILSISYVENGQDAIPPSNPFRLHYTFVGWDDEYNNINSDVSLHALYEKQIKVQFVDYDNTLLKEEYIDKNSTANEPESPSRDKYNFVGWDNELTNVTTDTIFTAQYELKTFTVQFVMPDDSLINEQKVVINCDAIEPDIPETYIDKRESLGVYKFSRWDKSCQNVSDNIIVKAIYDTPIEEPVIMVDTKVINRGVTSIEIGVYLIGNFTTYGANIELNFDSALKISSKEKVTLGSIGGTCYTNVENNEDPNYLTHCISIIWTNPIGLTVNGNVKVCTLSFTIDEYQSIGTYSIVLNENTYFVNSNVEKEKDIVLIDGDIIIK